ncbi:hypothetical protein GTP91_12970 [Rugamonas sp. FT82W]|uniref:O-antigen ligase domain-containing protein n=1 Tax=Duganella vulcania TaxID=2692166 RepID=A0A845G5V4_9BURK|nr:hypothetical protein [Duganella vulcania]MYM88088.1 hypothetical protein [Duganella vulcania]
MKLFKLQKATGLPPQGQYARRRAAGPSRWKLGVAGVAVMLFAIFLGLVAAVGGLRMTIIIGGALMVIPLVWFIRARTLLPLLFVFIFLIQGPVGSMLHVNAITWVGSGLAFLFLVRVLLEMFLTKLSDREARHGWTGAASVMIAVGIYLMFFFFGLATSDATMVQRVSAIRFGLPMFGVLLLLANAELSEGRLRLLWKLVIAIMVLQLPLVAYQHFFGMGAIGWDAVVGSFGPGQSAEMVMFCIAALLYAVALWNRSLMGPWMLALLTLVALADMLLGEVKAIIFWVPIGLVLVLRRRFFRNLGTLIAYSAVTVLFVACTFMAYKAMYWGEGVSGNTVSEKAQKAGGYFFDPYEVHYDTGEVGRFASLYIWYRDPTVDMVHRMIGYGPGAVAVSQTIGRGVIAKRYRPLAIAATALSVLLWDVGVLGALAFLGALLLPIWSGWRYVARGEGTPHGRAMVDTCLAVLVLLSTTLIYNRSLLDESSVQLLFLFCVGCIVHQCRFGRRVEPAAAPAHNAPPGLSASALNW